MISQEHTLNPNSFEQELIQIYTKPFFTGENASVRKSCFVAIIGYVLEQGMTVSLDKFSPISLIEAVASRAGLELPNCLTSVSESSDWQDGWNQEILEFDKQVQKKLTSYSLVVALYRNSKAG